MPATEGLRRGRMVAMGAQPITVELRRWIAEQTQAGVPAGAVLEAMLASGWRRAVARAALAQARRALAPRGAPGAMPGPALHDAAHSIRTADREVQVLVALREPRVVVFGGLLDAAECDELVALARERLVRSETVAMRAGGSEVNPARTSEGMFFRRGENPLVARIEARIATLLRWPVENGEGLQILRYRPGEEYKPHYDYFDPAAPGAAAILARGGQRLASLVIYLEAPARGGATCFPDIGLEVMPARGNAVFFSYERADPDSRTLHGSAPVLEGEKWVATQWLREARFD
jgi:prolyl 4-hydroxylase